MTILLLLTSSGQEWQFHLLTSRELQAIRSFVCNTKVLILVARVELEMSSNLAGRPSSANASPSTRAEMTCIPLHKIWQMNYFGWWIPQFQSRDAMHTSTQILQMNLLWPMDPLVPEQRCLEYQYSQYFADATLPNGPHKVTGQRCLHTANDIYWSRMAISHCYWHLVVKNGNFTLLLTSSGHEWQFHIATDI